MKLFIKYGFRNNRNKNRFYFLIKSVGMETITDAMRKEAGINFQTAGIALTKMDFVDSDQGKTMLKDGTFALHSVVMAGVFSGSDMIKATNVYKRYGSGSLSIDIEQNLYLWNIKKDNIDDTLKESYFNKHKSLASPYANHLIACAGLEHCQFGVIPNKPDAIELTKYLEEKVPLGNDAKIRLYWSACVKGCGLHDLGDVGFEGCKVKFNDQNEYGVHIFLGGKNTRDVTIAKSILKSVPLRFAKYFVESLMLEYKRMREKRETFEHFYSRIINDYSKAGIGFMLMILTYIRVLKLDIEIGFKKDIKTGKNEIFEIFEIGRALYKSIAKRELYEVYNHFTPTFPRKLDKLKDIQGYDKVFTQMINDMLRTEKRVEVFSEFHFQEIVFDILSTISQ